MKFTGRRRSIARAKQRNSAENVALAVGRGTKVRTMNSARIRKICLVALSAACASLPGSASAFFFPYWSGCWGGPGYGYAAPAPAYGAYYGAYSPVWPSPMASGFYQAGYASYGSGNGYCAPTSCCDPCGNACVGGNCVGGACGASCAGTGSSTDSLKPAADPNFRSKSDDLPDPAPADRTAPGSSDGFRRGAPRDTYEPSRDPLDDFGAPGTSGGRARPTDPDWNPSGSGRTGAPGGSAPAADPARTPQGTPAGTDDDGLFPSFDELGPQRSNKPPMTDPQAPAVEGTPPGTAPAGEPAKPSADDFLSPTNEKPSESLFPEDGQSSIPVSKALYGSQLREVIPSTRLSRGSADRVRSSRTELSDNRQRQNAPMRWISIPLPADHARL